MKNIMEMIMKQVKTFIALSIGMLSMLGVAAESESRSIGMGVQGGVNFANASTPADMSSSSVTGFTAGINVNVRISDMFSFQPELMFAQRRANLFDNVGLKLTGKYNSIVLPALAKVSFGEGVRPYVFAGPVAILNISNEFEAQGAGTSGGLSFQPRTFDFAADFGVGVEVGALFGSLRYSLGLLDYDQSHADWKSNGIQMLVGMNF